MKQLFVVLILVLVFPGSGQAGKKDPAQTVAIYFDAVAAGDVIKIRKLTAPPLSEDLNTLLMNNEQYPEFLRSRYEGAAAEIGDVVRLKKGEREVDLIITYVDNRVSTIKLTLSKRKSGRWKIIGQRELID